VIDESRRLPGRSTRRPSERVEDCHGVEVVAPVSDLSIGDREHGDVSVGTIARRRWRFSAMEAENV
jgi:hypothetical protein